MKRALLVLMALVACRKADPDATSDKPKKPALTRCVVEKNGKDYSIAPRCDVSWTTKFELAAGETLTIGAGSRVRFSDPGEIASLGGTITARGTADQPIVLTSSDKEFTIWIDEAVGAEVAPVATFEHVELDHGSLRTRRSRGRVQLSDVRFRGAELALLVNNDDELVSAKRLTFDKNKVDMFAPAKTVSRVEESTFAAPIRLTRAPVNGVVTLPKAPAFLVDLLPIQDGTLTFPEGAVVKLSRGASITAIGEKAQLVAKKVHFTSSADAPKAGDWKALELDQSSSKLDGCTIEYGGSVRLPTDASKATIINTTFRNNSGAGIEAAECSQLEDASKGNTAPAGTLCKVYVPSDAFGYGGLGLTGTGPGAGWGDGIGLGTVGGFGGNHSGVLGGGSAAKPITKIVEKSVTVVGKLPPEVVKRIVRANFPRLRACYEQTRKSDSSVAGTIDVKLAIDATGAVTSATTSPGTIKHTGMLGCVKGVFRTLSFPEPESGVVTVSMTHEYAPL
jgi:hypothetical protein